MKFLLLSAFLFLTLAGFSQNLQLHYDFRHTTDPKLNSKNFPTFSFEYFRNIDTLDTGSFLLKLNAQLDGKNNNMGQVFTQVSQSLRFWKPKVYLSFNYSGGLGVTPNSFGYYLSNSFGVGAAYPFQWKGAWVATSLSFRINTFDKTSYDPQFNLYFGKGFINYKIFTAGSFVFWTQNRNQGNDNTKDLKGKKFAFFGDPQIWFRIKNGFSIGSRINVYYHLLSEDDQIQFYPTLGTKYQF
ncbi:MAG: DUF5020 family protein [Bacteroidia bacterium]|nr:DUF5020 family protein [Bacteroidia bacterium]